MDEKPPVDPNVGTEKSLPSESSREPQAFVSGRSDETLFDDVVDQEFIEFEDESATPAARPSTFRHWFNGYSFVAALVLASIVYWNLVHHDAGPPVPVRVVVPGWDDLASCSFLISLDGAKHLTLFENHRAQLSEVERLKNGDPKNQNEDRWSFDENSKLYSLTLNKETTVYALVSPVEADGCMLINGNLEAANLRRSWFSTHSDDYEPIDDYEPPDRG
jgi:hypothetical protein